MNAVSEESANCSLVILICSTFTANFGEQAHKQSILDQELEKFMDNASNPNKVRRPIISEEATMFTSFR